METRLGIDLPSGRFSQGLPNGESPEKSTSEKMVELWK
jgi:hypothetical protein